MEKNYSWTWSVKENGILRGLIIALSVAIMLVFRFVPPFPGLSSSAMAVIGTFIGVLILWLVVSIDWPSLLCILALGTIEGLTFKGLFAGSFGSDTFVFLLCTFICTYALSQTVVIKKIAVWFVSNRLAQKGPWAFTTMFFFSVILIGMFISPSVLFVIMLPMLQEIFKITKIEKGSKVGSMLMLGLAFAVSISSGMTPIAHIFPILAMGVYTTATGVTINYLSYMAIAIPVGIVLTILMILMFRVIMRPDMSALRDINLDELKQDTGKMTKKDVITLVVFGVVVLLWILPGILQNIWPQFYTILNGYGTAFPAIIGVVILCIIRVDKKPLVSIPEAVKNGVPFSALIMCAGTLCLASALTNDTIGIKTFLVNNLSGALAGVPAALLLIIFAIWAMLQTNISSNMVTATLVATVAVPIMMATNSFIPVEVVVIVIGMISAFAFATPPSMPHIALASSSEYANTKGAFLYGGLLGILSVIVAVGAALSIGLLIF